MSNEPQYTPGPYHIRREQRARDTLVEIRGSTEITPMGPLVAVVKSALKRTEADAALLSAAPDMARALLQLLDGWGTNGLEDAKEAANAALRKAGVL